MNPALKRLEHEIFLPRKKRRIGQIKAAWFEYMKAKEKSWLFKIKRFLVKGFTDY